MTNKTIKTERDKAVYIELIKKMKKTIDNGNGTRNCRVLFRWGVGNLKKQHSIQIIPKTKNIKLASKNVDVALLDWFENMGSLPELLTKETTPLDKIFEKYLSIEYQDFKEGTRLRQRQHFNRIKKLIPSNNILKLTKDFFENNLVKIRGSSNAKGWKDTLSALNKFFNWCVKNEYLSENPAKSIPVPKGWTFNKKDIENIWTEKRFLKVRKQLSRQQDKDFLTDMWFTGMDPGDIFCLKKKHIKEVSKGDWRVQKIREKAKSPEEFINLPISSAIFDRWLNKYNSKGDPNDQLFTFTHRGGIYLDRESFVNNSYAKIVTAQELLEYKETRTQKELRHTFASRHAQNGVPEWTLKEWMGHAPGSRVLEKLYLHLKSVPEYMD